MPCEKGSLLASKRLGSVFVRVGMFGEFPGTVCRFQVYPGNDSGSISSRVKSTMSMGKKGLHRDLTHLLFSPRSRMKKPTFLMRQVTNKRKGFAYLDLVHVADGMVELDGTTLLQTSLLGGAAV